MRRHVLNNQNTETKTVTWTTTFWKHPQRATLVSCDRLRIVTLIKNHYVWYSCIVCWLHCLGYRSLHNVYFRMDRYGECVFWNWMPKHRKRLDKLSGGLPSILFDWRLAFSTNFARIHVSEQASVQLSTGSMKATMYASWGLVLSLLFLQLSCCLSGRPTMSLLP